MREKDELDAARGIMTAMMIVVFFCLVVGMAVFSR